MMRRSAPSVIRTGEDASPDARFSAGDEVAPGDGELLGRGVARQRDEFEAVPQGRGDTEPLVGGGQEEDLGEVERQLDERVPEPGLLHRVQSLEEDRGGVAADLVDLVQHEDRVAVPRPPQLPED